MAQLIDRVIISRACAAQAKPGLHAPRCEEAMELLKHTDFFCDFARPASEIKWITPTQLQFTSQVYQPWEEANVVHAQMFRGEGDWQKKPTILLIHGWNDEFGYRYQYPLFARKLVRAGMNAVLMELPFTLQRRPRKTGAVNDFISEDLFCTVQAARQSICDVRSIVRWLSEQGCQRLGLWGVSLGGWISGLILAHEPLIEMGVLVVPITRMDLAIANLDFCAPLRRTLENVSFDFEKINLRSYEPKVARDKMLFIEAEHDLFADKEAIEELGRIWQPEIWRIPHGHITALFSLPLMNRTVKWIEGKMLAAPEREVRPGIKATSGLRDPA
jgi:pimeloyl-ACP methyl ester carboxylesterase